MWDTVSTKWWFCDQTVALFNIHAHMIPFQQIKELPDKHSPADLSARYAIPGVRQGFGVVVSHIPLLQLDKELQSGVISPFVAFQFQPQIDEIDSRLRNHNGPFLLVVFLAEHDFPFDALFVAVFRCRQRHCRVKHKGETKDLSWCNLTTVSVFTLLFGIWDYLSVASNTAQGDEKAACLVLKVCSFYWWRMLVPLFVSLKFKSIHEIYMNKWNIWEWS